MGRPSCGLVGLGPGASASSTAMCTAVFPTMPPSSCQAMWNQISGVGTCAEQTPHMVRGLAFVNGGGCVGPKVFPAIVPSRVRLIALPVPEKWTGKSTAIINLGSSRMRLTNQCSALTMVCRGGTGLGVHQCRRGCTWETFRAERALSPDGLDTGQANSGVVDAVLLTALDTGLRKWARAPKMYVHPIRSGHDVSTRCTDMFGYLRRRVGSCR